MTQQSSCESPAVSGVVDSISSNGSLLIRGQWYELPSSWRGLHPSVGQSVTVRYQRVILDIQPSKASSSSTRNSTTSPSTYKSGQARRAAPAKPASSNTPPSKQAAAQTISGVIDAVNARGLKIHQTWYNYSSLTPVPPDIRAKLTKGASVSLTIENGRWIASVKINHENSTADVEEWSEEY